MAASPSETPGIPSPEATCYRFSARAMASPLRLSIRGDWRSTSLKVATQGWAEVREEFEACEQAMSRFRETSGITRLNRAVGLGLCLSVEGRLRSALVAARRAERVTDGRFDPRVLLDLERLGYRGAAVGHANEDEGDVVDGPARRWLSGAEPHGWLALRRSGPCASLARPIDLGGIGKGLALRWARNRVRHVLAGAEAGGHDASRREAGPHAAGHHSVIDGPSFLIEAGGDLVAEGVSPEGDAWLVGIENPSGANEPVAVIAASNVAVATSSVVVNRWLSGDGRPVHHLIDPRTGEPGGDGLLSVTVAGPDPAWSEVWSKALFLAGEAAIGDEARRRALAAWWVTSGGELRMTAAARRLTVWEA